MPSSENRYSSHSGPSHSHHGILKPQNVISKTGAICMAIYLVFAIIEGSITAFLVARYNSDDSYPSNRIRDRVRFLLFTSWWTVAFTILYIIAFFYRFMGVFASIASHVVWAFITWVFWLSAAAAYTQSIGGGIRCGHRHIIHCHQLVAAEAFAWIEWILFFGWFLWVLFLGFKAWRNGEPPATDMREVA